MRKEQNDLPKIYFPETKKSCKVNTKTMLKNFHTIYWRYLPINFDNDTAYNEEYDTNFYKDKYDFFKNADTIFPKYDVKVSVDDSYTIDTKGFEYKNIPIPANESTIIDGLINGRIPTQDEQNKSIELIKTYCNLRFKQWDDYVKCYPLLIFNNENKNIPIRKIKLIQEAKDKNGQWMPIEFFEDMNSCIVSHHYLRLEKKKYLALPIIKYYGDYKTKLRVKILINDYFYYSNEFDGTINLSQFDTSYLIAYLKCFDSKNDRSNHDYIEESKFYLLQKK